jgi:peptidoglycan/xylan/chitin deacetylase (PgdA/CDA1 family)
LETTPAETFPDRDQVIATYADRVPREWGTDVTGVVSTLGDVGIAPSDGLTRVGLTFDACGGGGAGDGVDSALLETLVRYAVPATLFLNARWIAVHPGLARELADNPLFGIACHGTAHVPLSVTGRSAYGIAGTDSVGAVYDELTGNVDWFTETTGRRPQFSRPGTAHCDEVAAAIAGDLGMPVAGFSVNGDGGSTFSSGMVRDVLLAVTDQDIVLAHMNRPEGGTARGVGDALPRLLDRGVEFVSLTDLQAEDR